MWKEWNKVFFEKKKKKFGQIFLQLASLPALGHKEAIGTFGYPIALKLED